MNERFLLKKERVRKRNLRNSYTNRLFPFGFQVPKITIYSCKDLLDQVISPAFREYSAEVTGLKEIIGTNSEIRRDVERECV